MADRILRGPAAAAKLGLPISSLYEWLHEPPKDVPPLPRPRKVGLRSVGWLESELDALIASLPTTDPKPRASRRKKSSKPASERAA
jgi:prophage regulatory protein